MPYTINDDGHFEGLFPTPGRDLIFASHGERDEFHGLAGDDNLYGFGGRDHLFGGSGEDWLYGGKGRDTLWGGPGRDTFVYQTTSDCRDKIKDFVPGEDVIDIGISSDGSFDRGLDGLSFNPDTRRLTYSDDDGRTTLIAKLNTAIFDIDRDVTLT